ncbi:hypothetical protein O181_004496 [Austropuccinia psidii MF-1]|uniref:DUF4939 domain-containing protein n=1 Tax=Austropuccinia psidii MF-1 TaxID=1389203 RepID=A0A9Q3BH05_9BASI|nr:hypothetical protein [Austropuccinia psidii MF-1]
MEVAAPSSKELRGPRRSSSVTLMPEAINKNSSSPLRVMLEQVVPQHHHDWTLAPPSVTSSFSEVVDGFPGISRTTFRGPGEDDVEGKENSVEEEKSHSTEASPAPVGTSQGSGGPTLAQSDQPVSNQSEPSLWAIMHQITQIMANPQSASSSEASRPPDFMTLSMRAPYCFDGTQPLKVRSFIQLSQLIFHNDKENFWEERKKFLYATSFLIGRASKWIEPCLSNLTNEIQS